MVNFEDKLWPDLVVSAHSRRWIAAVQKAAAGQREVQLDWVASVEDAFMNAMKHQGSAVIAELPGNFRGENLINKLARFSAAPNRAMLFVLGNEDHESIRDSIIRLGIPSIATSILEFDSLWANAIRHLRMHEIGKLSVEELIEARFPL